MLPTEVLRPFAFKGRGESPRRGGEGVPPPALGTKAPQARGAHLNAPPHAPGHYSQEGEEEGAMLGVEGGDARGAHAQRGRLSPQEGWQELAPAFRAVTRRDARQIGSRQSGVAKQPAKPAEAKRGSCAKIPRSEASILIFYLFIF